MKFLIAILALVAVAAADVSHIRNTDKDAEITLQSSDVRPDGFNNEYQTSNGIAAKEEGQLVGIGDDASIVVQGANSYTSPEGEVIKTEYTADENGYHPQGAHLPTPPPAEPIPEYIQRSIAYNAAHAQPEGPAARKF